jgi:hypothetical protein
MVMADFQQLLNLADKDNSTPVEKSTGRNQYSYQSR